MPRLYKLGNQPKGAVYIGRPSPFGNPFEITESRTRAEAIELFANWFEGNVDLQDQVLKELVGKDLVCFCYPKPCHGQVYLDFLKDENDKLELAKLDGLQF